MGLFARAVESLTLRGIATAGLTALTAWLLKKLYIDPVYRSTVANVPGPDRGSLLFGKLSETLKVAPGIPEEAWCKEHDSRTIQYRGLLGGHTLFTSDPQVLHHVLLKRPYQWPKPPLMRDAVKQLTGDGLFTAEGDTHKRQRKVLHSAFTQQNVNQHFPIFQGYADKMVSLMKTVQNERDDSRDGSLPVLDMYDWISRYMLDSIAKAGFGWEMGTLENAEDEFATAIRQMLVPDNFSILFIVLVILRTLIPALEHIPNKYLESQTKMGRIAEREGNRILMERKRAVELGGEAEHKDDLLGLIVKANMQPSNEKDRLSDEELRGQILTFIFAGQETTTGALLWILLHLAQHPKVQDKLRGELVAAAKDSEESGEESMSLESLESLPYLDSVIRESLRYNPPVYISAREAAEDDILPLSKPTVGRDGASISNIRVKKGQTLVLGLHAFNHSTEVFGPDANVYRPERWLGDEGQKLMEDLQAYRSFSTYSSFTTFLGGPRGCIGFRLANLGIKTVLASLVSNFEFHVKDEGGTPVMVKHTTVTRPSLEEAGTQFPMRVRSIKK